MNSHAVDERRSPRVWYAVDVLIDPAAREAIEYGLMEAEALGTETNDAGSHTKVRGYFDQPPDVESIKQSLVNALVIYDLDATTGMQLSVHEVPDRDWLAEWKKSWRPVEVGRFFIAPPWFVSEPEAVASGPIGSMSPMGPVATAPGSDRILIRINPGMAFDTGTHQTTRLCL